MSSESAFAISLQRTSEQYFSSRSDILAGYYFIKVCKFDKFIATLAALPGAFVPIAAALLEYGKKENHKQVLIPQATRVIFIVSFNIEIP